MFFKRNRLKFELYYSDWTHSSLDIILIMFYIASLKLSVWTTYSILALFCSLYEINLIRSSVLVVVGYWDRMVPPTRCRPRIGNSYLQGDQTQWSKIFFKRNKLKFELYCSDWTHSSLQVDIILIMFYIASLKLSVWTTYSILILFCTVAYMRSI